MAENKTSFAKGDLNSVMDAYPHVKEYVEEWQQRGGTTPMYYGPLDRDAKGAQENLNLIYVTREPIFVHVHQPIEDNGSKGRILWFALEPSLTVSETKKKNDLVDILLKEAPNNNSSFSGEGAFETLLRNMIDEHTVLDDSSLRVNRKEILGNSGLDEKI